MPFFKRVLPGTASRLSMVDHNETFGRHILKRVIKSKNITACLDLGFGGGQDLTIIKNEFPKAKLYGVDFLKKDHEKVSVFCLNIERDLIPLEDESVDFIIANQILEHTKEIYWINHEISRVLKKDGYIFLGVPNGLSFHNRILGLFGFHPTTSKMISAHIRIFSKRDTYFYYKTIAKSFLKVTGFFGAQFYPFPRVIARFLSRLFPSMAVSNFYLIQKTNHYNNEFIEYRKNTPVQTNFYLGK